MLAYITIKIIKILVNQKLGYLSYNINISTHCDDIANEEDIKKMFDEFISHHGSIYALINNASTIFHTCRLEDMSVDRLQKVFQVNAIGNIVCAKHTIKNMSQIWIQW